MYSPSPTNTRMNIPCLFLYNLCTHLLPQTQGWRYHVYSYTTYVLTFSHKHKDEDTMFILIHHTTYVLTFSHKHKDEDTMFILIHHTTYVLTFSHKHKDEYTMFILIHHTTYVLTFSHQHKDEYTMFFLIKPMYSPSPTNTRMNIPSLFL